MQAKRLQLSVRRPQFNFIAKSEDAFKRGACLIDQSHHDLSIASLVATLDQGNVSVADVLVDHRVAFNFQRIDSLGTNSAEKKPRHTDHFSIFDASIGAPAAMRPTRRTSHTASAATSPMFTANVNAPSSWPRLIRPRFSSAPICLAIVAFELTPKCLAICAYEGSCPCLARSRVMESR